MKLILIVALAAILCSYQKNTFKESHFNNVEDHNKNASDSIIKTNYAEYWVNLDYLESLEKEISICDCWRQNKFLLLYIDFEKLELIVHSNLFYAGMDTQEILPLIADGQKFMTVTSEAWRFNEPIYFDRPYTDTLEIAMGQSKYKFVKKKFELKNQNSKSGGDSNSSNLFDFSHQLNSHILLKYNLLDTIESTSILIPVDSLKKLIVGGFVNGHCSDDFYFDGITIEVGELHHYHLEFTPGKVILYDERDGRGRHEEIDLKSLPKQIMRIGN